MTRAKELKKVQIQKKKYALPAEEVQIHKLVTKGLSLNGKLKAIKRELESIKGQLIDIAETRREGSTTVKLQTVSGPHSVITFRESYVCDDAVEEISQEIGSLFDRFFTKKVEFKTSKELKQFLDGVHTYGIENPDTIKKLVFSHVQKKSIKPNVKIVGAE